MLKIHDEWFLAIVTKINEAGVIYKDHTSDIFRIKEVLLISFTYGTNINKLSSQTRAIVAGICTLLQQGFYFSYHYDLTNSLQRSSKMPASGSTLFDRGNKHYIWNYSLSKKFTSEFVSTKWLTPVIQGYVGTAEDEIKGKKLKLILISRRMHRRAGTRYNARGIDDNGNVANYVETEQIVIYDKKTFSYVQVRGSVPLYWSQTGMMASIQLTRTQEMSHAAFTKHFDDLVKHYKSVLIFDLLSDTKAGENILVQAYRNNALIYSKREDSKLMYCHFDFHHERANSPVFFLYKICKGIRCYYENNRQMGKNSSSIWLFL